MKNKDIVIGIALLVVLACVFAIGKLHSSNSIAPLTPRTVAAEKVPDGWYESLGTSSVTVATLTKQDKYVISITSDAATDTPEAYVAQVGFAGVNADAMGLKGAWSTFMGH